MTASLKWRRPGVPSFAPTVGVTQRKRPLMKTSSVLFAEDVRSRMSGCRSWSGATSGPAAVVTSAWLSHLHPYQAPRRSEWRRPFHAVAIVANSGDPAARSAARATRRTATPGRGRVARAPRRPGTAPVLLARRGHRLPAASVAVRSDPPGRDELDHDRRRAVVGWECGRNPASSPKPQR
jgi:hypothetical protein